MNEQKRQAFIDEFKELRKKHGVVLTVSREYCYCEGPCAGHSQDVYMYGNETGYIHLEDISD